MVFEQMVLHWRLPALAWACRPWRCTSNQQLTRTSFQISLCGARPFVTASEFHGSRSLVLGSFPFRIFLPYVSGIVSRPIATTPPILLHYQRQLQFAAPVASYIKPTVVSVSHSRPVFGFPWSWFVRVGFFSIQVLWPCASIGFRTTATVMTIRWRSCTISISGSLLVHVVGAHRCPLERPFRLLVLCLVSLQLVKFVPSHGRAQSDEGSHAFDWGVQS